MRSDRILRNVALGAALSLGAPAGWLLLRIATGDVRLTPNGLAVELTAFAAFYVYLAFGTSLAFVAFGAVLGVFEERLARANEQLREQTLTDALTGLRNPRYFHARLEEECTRAERDRSPLSLIMLDLDLFKRINDAYGHAAGDRVLETAAQVLRSSARASDVACRIGGEELALLCPRTSLDEALAIAERLRTRLEAARTIVARHALTITASVGVAAHAPGGTAAALFGAADDALYAAKRAGRNRVARSTGPFGSVEGPAAHI